MKIPVRLILVLPLALVALPLFAGLDGTQVKGALYFSDAPKTFNYFDPLNGFVPPGYKNDAGTTVTIGPGELDFCAEACRNLYTANFTDNQLKITEDEDGDPVPPFMMTFTDPAFLSITKVFDNFDHGGISFRLVGETIILSRNRDVSLDDHYAIFDIGTASPPPPVPEPGSLLLLGTGLFTLAGFVHRKYSM
ncbi:MAG: PEP-CTERM sorting domain-containing protein [Chthoniobacterales bacterium]